MLAVRTNTLAPLTTADGDYTPLRVNSEGALHVTTPAAAIVGSDCRLAYADELARLRYDYEQEFLDDNRFRIAELITPVS